MASFERPPTSLKLIFFGIFKDIFELGNKGMKNPKKELRNATYKLAKKLKN